MVTLNSVLGRWQHCMHYFYYLMLKTVLTDTLLKALVNIIVFKGGFLLLPVHFSLASRPRPLPTLSVYHWPVPSLTAPPLHLGLVWLVAGRNRYILLVVPVDVCVRGGAYLPTRCEWSVVTVWQGFCTIDRNLTFKTW